MFCCRKYLWGKKLYWICEYIAIKEMIDYCGSIHQLRCWSQDFFVYEFTIIHRIACTMKDVDGLSRHIDPLIHRYLVQAYIKRAKDTV